MFEITNDQLRNNSFVTGMRKILAHPSGDVKTNYNLGRMGVQLNGAQKDAEVVLKKLIKNYGKFLDSGKFEIDDDKVEDWKKAHKEFLDHSTKVERHKIRVETLEGIPLTPSEVAALEPLLDGLDTLNG